MALGELVDGFGRRLNYVRISVTDRCNFRCTYCMPEEGVKCLSHRDILRYEDIAFLCKIFTELGVGKFRFMAENRLCVGGWCLFCRTCTPRCRT